PRRPAFDATFFLGRKPCLEGAGYLLGDRALDGEYVGQLAIVAISPDLPIVVGVAQPRLDAYAIACPLYGALEYGGHTAPRRCHRPRHPRRRPALPRARRSRRARARAALPERPRRDLLACGSCDRR